MNRPMKNKKTPTSKHLIMNRFLTIAIIGTFLVASAQTMVAQKKLQPGFDKEEYTETLRMASSFASDSFTMASKIEEPIHFQRAYRSPVMGLENRWDLWISNDSVAAISIRGSVAKALSWMANFYAGMVPAQGSLTLQDTIHYKLTDNQAAAVHAGWLTATLFLAADILPKIDSCHNAGIKDFIVTGHSQGGAISFILTALLYQKQEEGIIPADIRFKTYCSAAPKPGNTQFAYEYENMTRGGWAYNVVNAVDWVPETPLTVQTLNDFVPNNPFTEVKKMISQQKKMSARIKYRYLYSQLANPTFRSERRIEKYLGKSIGKMVEAQVKNFNQPEYFRSACYMRTGNTIILKPNELYFNTFPSISDDKFKHHMFNAYKFLIDHH